MFIILITSLTVPRHSSKATNCLYTVLTCGCSCRPPAGRWRSHNVLWGCCDAPWRPWKSSYWPPTEPLWQKARNTALLQPWGHLRYLEEILQLTERKRNKIWSTERAPMFSHLLPAAPQVPPQPAPRDDPYRTEPRWCGYSPTPLHAHKHRGKLSDAVITIFMHSIVLSLFK